MKIEKLTAPQKSIWSVEQYFKGSSVNNICGTIHFFEKINFDNLKKALNNIVETNDNFHLKFILKNSTILQTLKKNVNYNIQIFDISSEKGGKKLQEKAGRGLYWALFIFVGIPLPGTGAWTGTLAASLLDMDFKKSSIAVMAGVILAGIIMGLASAGVFGAAGAILGA